MSEQTENIEEVVEEVVEGAGEASDNGYEGLNEVEQVLAERQDAKNAAKAVVEGEVIEEQVVEEVVEQVADEPEYVFTLKDGTGVTLEEAEKGYMLHADYSRKRSEAAVVEKELAQYSGIINWLKANPDEINVLMDKAQGKAPVQQVQKATMTEVQVPQGYENEPAIKMLVDELNKTRTILAEVSGGVSTINKEKTEQQKRTDIDTVINNRMTAAYDELKGQMETPPTPQEFQERLFAHFEELNLSKADVEASITGPDPTYLSAKVERIFKADISKATQAKGADVEKDRKKRVAKTRTLGVAGKSRAAAPQSLPKGKDGKMDHRAALLMIEEEKAKAARR